jgi:hypothetical protein
MEYSTVTCVSYGVAEIRYWLNLSVAVLYPTVEKAGDVRRVWVDPPVKLEAACIIGVPSPAMPSTPGEGTI